MRIGIDMDDTICQTTEIVQDRLEKYGEEIGLNPLDIMNDEVLKDEFFEKCSVDIYENVDIKRNAAEVIKRLRSKGNEIYLITSRPNHFANSSKSGFDISDEWLKKHGVEADAIISSAYGETRAEICKKYDIDLMIDDDPYNYQKIVAMGKKCLLFDDQEKFVLKEDYVSNWIEVEKYIEQNH